MKPANIVEFALVFADEARAALKGALIIDERSTVYKPILKPSVMSAVVEEIAKLAHKMEYLNLKSCNVGSTEADDARWDKYKARITELCAQYNIKPVFQGDPRGAAVGIICEKTDRHNSWGGHESGFRLNFEGR